MKTEAEIVLTKLDANECRGSMATPEARERQGRLELRISEGAWLR